MLNNAHWILLNASEKTADNTNLESGDSQYLRFTLRLWKICFERIVLLTHMRESSLPGLKTRCCEQRKNELRRYSGHLFSVILTNANFGVTLHSQWIDRPHWPSTSVFFSRFWTSSFKVRFNVNEHWTVNGANPKNRIAMNVVYFHSFFSSCFSCRRRKYVCEMSPTSEVRMATVAYCNYSYSVEYMYT